MNPFKGTAMFMMPPFGIQPQMMEQPDRHQQGDIVPTRVLKAFEFLQILNQKTMQRGIASDSLIQIMDPEKLTTEETSAQCTALGLLEQYFSGRLSPDGWEKVRLDAAKLETAQASFEAEVRNKSMKLIKCVACQTLPKPRSNCPLCEGSGTLLVMAGHPLSQMEEGPGGVTEGTAKPDESEASE